MEKTRAWFNQQAARAAKLKAARKIAANRRRRQSRENNPDKREQDAQRMRDYRQNNLESVREQERLRYHKNKTTATTP